MSELKLACNDRAIRNALVTSISFFLVFTAFGAAQNFATSANATVGSISLGILYGVFTVSNIFVPKILQYLSPKYAMFWGACTYFLFVASNIELYPPILYTTSAIEGVGAALLWVAQGTYITECAGRFEFTHGLPLHSKLGYFNGLFWLFFQGNQLVGNLLCALLFQFNSSKRMVYIVLSIICAFGCCCFLIIRPFPSPQQQEQQQEQQQQHHNLLEPAEQNKDILIPKGSSDSIASEGYEESPTKRGENQQQRTKNVNKNNNISSISNKVESKEVPSVDIWAALRMWADPRLQIIAIITLYTGLSQAFEFGEFPTYIDANSHKFYAMAIFGFADSAFSLWFGRISDNVGRLPILAVSAICHAFVYMYLFFYVPKQSELYLYFIVAVFLGIGDAGFNTQIAALYPSLLSKKDETFANYKFFQSLATAWGFMWHSYVSSHTKLITYFAFLIAGIVILFYSKDVRMAARKKILEHS